MLCMVLRYTNGFCRDLFPYESHSRWLANHSYLSSVPDREYNTSNHSRGRLVLFTGKLVLSWWDSVKGFGGIKGPKLLRQSLTNEEKILSPTSSVWPNLGTVQSFLGTGISLTVNKLLVYFMCKYLKKIPKYP